MPIILLTGFLGSGKTTLLNHLLSNNNQLRLAAIRNEYTDAYDRLFETPLLIPDGDLTAYEELPNSCVCCTASSRLTQAVQRLLAIGRNENKPFAHVIIEASGIADPMSMVINLSPEVNEDKNSDLKCIVTVVDSSTFDKFLNDESVRELFIKQLVVADVILLNKVDRVTSDRKQIENMIRELNPVATIVETVNSAVDINIILDAEVTTESRLEKMEHTAEHVNHFGVMTETFEFPTKKFDRTALENDVCRLLWSAEGIYRWANSKQQWIAQSQGFIPR